MNLSMEVVGLEQLRRSFGNAPKIVDAEARKGVRKSAEVVRLRAVQNARKFSIGVKFPQSIRYKIQQGGLVAHVGSLARTGKSIEEGRRPGEVVRFGLILGWIQRKGLMRSVSVKTQRVRKVGKRRLSDVDREERRFAAEVVEQIRRTGTSPLAFLIPAAHSEAGKVKAIFQGAVRDALKRLKA